ncbi:50S ribosomal protein L1 [Patescibacteria group bacterium]|nr:50S ribosomal protein L1 [Patescibacteria group bacterium]
MQKKEITIYKLEDALKQICEGAKEKFDATVEVHINLDLDQKKQDQMIRFSLVLPNGTGKSKKVAVMASEKIAGADLELTESDLDKIEKGELKAFRDFDVIITEPKFMPKLAKVARTLGPAGVMPNPKNGTVTENVAKAVEQTKKGKVDIKMEQNAPIIHTIIGKVSFGEKSLEENFKDLLANLKQNKPSKAKPNWIKNVYIGSSMGKSYSIGLEA